MRPSARIVQALSLLTARRGAEAEDLLAAVAREGAPDAERACFELVQIFLHRGEQAGTEDALRRHLASRPRLLSCALGYHCRRTGRLTEARRLHEEALAGGAHSTAIALDLGWTLCLLGERAAGLRHVEAAEAECRLVRDEWGLATAGMHRATLALRDGRVRPALALLRRVIALRQRCHDRAGTATALHNAGVASSQLTDHAGALVAFERALDAWRTLGNAAGEAAALNGLARCHLELGAPERARARLAVALRAARRAGPAALASMEAAIETNLALACQRLGAARGALLHLRRALDLQPAERDASSHALAAGALAEMLTLRGRAADALEVVAKARIATRAPAGERSALKLDTEEARARLAAGDALGALALVNARLAGLREGDAPGGAHVLQFVDLRLVQVRALLVAGDHASATRSARLVARVIERLLDALPGGALRMGLVDHLREADDVRLEVELARGPSGMEGAWLAAEGAKARHLQLFVSGPRRAGQAAAEMERAVRRLATQERAGRVDLRQLAELGTRHADLAAQRRERARRSERRPATVSPAALSRRLGPATALLEFHVARETTRAFVVHGGEVRAIDLRLSEAGLDRLVDRLVAPLRSASRAVDASAHLAGFDVAGAHRAFRRILEPALRLLPKGMRRLVIVPDGALHRLPFGALASRPPDEHAPPGLGSVVRARFVADDWQLCVVPAARFVLGRTQRRAPRRAPARALVFSYSPPEGAVVHGPEGSLVLDPLPGAAREAAAVARIHAGSRLLDGRAATAEAFLGAAREARWIHVAAHGLSDSRAPLLSGIVVAAEGEAARVDLLTAHRVGSLRTRARLAVLATCEGGRGRLVAREGILSLARGFLEAGAAGVLAASWPVDDVATLAFMTRFHRRLAQGDSPSAALAAAVASMRRKARGASPHLAHPYAWAGFVLLDSRAGDGSP